MLSLLLVCAIYSTVSVLSAPFFRSQTSPSHLHGFPLLDYYPHGVVSMAFHHGLNILIVGSCTSD